MRVYLAGAVELVSMPYAKAWRSEAKRIAAALTDLTLVDPLDYEYEILPGDAEIVRTDKYLVANCDAILMDGRQPGWGTGVELAWADTLSIPVFVWGISHPKAPVFLRHFAAGFEESLTEAILKVASVSLP